MLAQLLKEAENLPQITTEAALAYKAHTEAMVDQVNRSLEAPTRRCIVSSAITP